MFGDLLSRRGDASGVAGSDMEASRSNRQRRRGATKAVGVELAAGAIRAAYADGEHLVVGEVPLADGVIVGGEILDAGAVTEALRSLWEQHHFPTKKVVLGIASPDIVTRPVSLPPMSAKDVRSALPFELADRVPFPIGEAVIDAVAMDGYPTEDGAASADGVELIAVLALQSTLRRATSLATRAGLSVLAVEPPAFALVRAAGRNDVLSHAIVDLGADTLVVAVHRCRVLQFYRSVLTRQGGSMSSSELEAELVFIEQFRRKAAGAEGLTLPGSTRDHPLVSAIRGTLEYAASQPGAVPVDAVTLAGDHDRCEEVAAALGPSLAVPLNVIDPVARAGLAVPALGRGSAFTTAIGLSLAPETVTQGPRRLDLLPRSDSTGTSPRRLALHAGLAAVSTAVVLGGVTATVGPDSDGARQQIDQARAASVRVDGQLHQLAGPLASVREITSISRSLERVRALDTDWGRLTQEIRAAAPAEVQIVSIDAKGRDPKRPSRGAGTIEVRGQAPNQSSITIWLDGLSRIEGVRDPWLDGASTGAGNTGAISGFTSFTITMNLDHTAKPAASEGSDR